MSEPNSSSDDSPGVADFRAVHLTELMAISDRPMQHGLDNGGADEADPFKPNNDLVGLAISGGG